MIDSIPRPLTFETAQEIESSSKVRELHPEVMTSRMSIGSIITAFFLKTEKIACEIVEKDTQDGYRVLSRDEPENEDEVYEHLRQWCEENGYHETH